jgi:DNA anti-recombination protein RmuC
MSLFLAKRLFDDSVKRLGKLKREELPQHLDLIYDVTNGLAALSDGLESEFRRVNEQLANIHRALTDAKGPPSDSP